MSDLTRDETRLLTHFRRWDGRLTGKNLSAARPNPSALHSLLGRGLIVPVGAGWRVTPLGRELIDRNRFCALCRIVELPIGNECGICGACGPDPSKGIEPTEPIAHDRFRHPIQSKAMREGEIRESGRVQRFVEGLNPRDEFRASLGLRPRR